jgi:DNA-binding beta-propeller fold protein YncE
MTSRTETSLVEYHYLNTIGNAAAPGQIGFRNPVDVALGEGGMLYVLSHAAENTPNGKRIAKCTIEEEYFLAEFGSFGTEDGQFTWPNSLAVAKDGNVYVTDEWLHRISVFESEGRFLWKWGTRGEGEGQWNRPAGITFDSEDNLLVVDSMNHRIQKYSKDGKFIAQWGGPGKHEGEFNTPWGITVDTVGDVYVADWRNNRIQKFTAEGRFLMQLGTRGDDDGQFNRPSGVAIDREGCIYVTDWGNDRVQVFDSEGYFITKFIGDAGMSKWGEERLSSNPESMLEQRARVKNFDPEKRFVQPTAVEVDKEDQIIVVDSARHRLQIYQKVSG